jgi:hypothetical protein
MSKPAADARAKANPCSFCSNIFLASMARNKRLLDESSVIGLSPPSSEFRVTFDIGAGFSEFSDNNILLAASTHNDVRFPVIVPQL